MSRRELQIAPVYRYPTFMEYDMQIRECHLGNGSPCWVSGEAYPFKCVQLPKCTISERNVQHINYIVFRYQLGWFIYKVLITQISGKVPLR